MPNTDNFLIELDGMIESTEEFIGDDGLRADDERIHDLSALLRVRDLWINTFKPQAFETRRLSPSQPLGGIMKCTTSDLHTMDMGVHQHLYHEWNEGTEGKWGDAMVLYRHPSSIVIQPYYPTSPSATGESEFLCIAVYRTAGEGDLEELYFADARNGIGRSYVGNAGHPDVLYSAFESGYALKASQHGPLPGPYGTRLRNAFKAWLKELPAYATEPVRSDRTTDRERALEAEVLECRQSNVELRGRVRELEANISDAYDALGSHD